MNFIEAILEMRKGKRIRQSNWREGLYLFLDMGYHLKLKKDNVVNLADFMVLMIDTDDWEVIEERKTLSDKIFTTQYGGLKSIKVDDLKATLKKFLESMKVEEGCVGLKSTDYIREKIIELFGEELVGD